MTETIIGQNRVTVWYQDDGDGSEFQLLGIGDNQGGMTGKSIPGPGSTPVYGRNLYGRPIVIRKTIDAPGGLPGATISIHEKAQIDFLWATLNKGCTLNIQERITKCGALNNPNRWDAIRHWADGEINNYTPSDGPSLTFDGSEMTIDAEVSFDHVIKLVQTALSGLTLNQPSNLLAITGLTEEDCNECANGYPGADQILYVGAQATTYLVTANVWYSTNGGGTFAQTSADPFAAGEDVNFVMVKFIDNDTIRLIVGTSTVDAAAKAKIAYADIDLGSEDTTSWTTVTITNTSNGDVITALAWLFFGRLYAASAGDIYVSTDQGESLGDAAVYTGSTQINGFAKSPDDRHVYAYGASNLILRETNKSGTFETRVGPSGGGAFTALTVAGDGTVYAGNGTSIYKSTDGAGVAGNWTQLKDFGASHSVVKIQCIGGPRAGGGNSQLLRAVVDDTTPSTGSVFLSVDGGATWVEETTLTNTGYNDAYFSEIDDNLAIIVGDESAGTGVVHKLSPEA